MRRVRKVYSRARRRVSRSKFSGVTSKVISGAALGAIINFAGPTINSNVPQLGPLSPMTVATLGGGIVAKSVLRKDPMGLSSAAIVLGSALAAGNLMSGMGVASNGNGGGGFVG